jgi:hypothetical protein
MTVWKFEVPIGCGLRGSAPLCRGNRAPRTSRIPLRDRHSGAGRGRFRPGYPLRPPGPGALQGSRQDLLGQRHILL